MKLWILDLANGERREELEVPQPTYKLPQAAKSVFLFEVVFGLSVIVAFLLFYIFKILKRKISKTE